MPRLIHIPRPAIPVMATAAIALLVPAQAMAAQEWRLTGEPVISDRQMRDDAGLLLPSEQRRGPGPLRGCVLNACNGEFGNGSFTLAFRTADGRDDQAFDFAWSLPPVLAPRRRWPLVVTGSAGGTGPTPLRQTLCMTADRSGVLPSGQPACRAVANNVAGVPGDQGEGAAPITIAAPVPRRARETFAVTVAVSFWAKATYTYRAVNVVAPGSIVQKRAPRPGGSTRVVLPVSPRSRTTQVRVWSSTGTDAGATVLSIEERSRLRRLRGTRGRLEESCYAAVGPTVLVDAIVGDQLQDLQREEWGRSRAGSLAAVCAKLLAEVQARIDALIGTPRARAVATSTSRCRVARFGLRSERRGRRWVTTVVRRGVAPRLSVLCSEVGGALRVTIRRRGAGVLRPVLGSRVRLTLRRSAARPALPARAVIGAWIR